MGDEHEMLQLYEHTNPLTCFHTRCVNAHFRSTHTHNDKLYIDYGQFLKIVFAISTDELASIDVLSSIHIGCIPWHNHCKEADVCSCACAYSIHLLFIGCLACRCEIWSASSVLWYLVLWPDALFPKTSTILFRNGRDCCVGHSRSSLFSLSLSLSLLVYLFVPFIFSPKCSAIAWKSLMETIHLLFLCALLNQTIFVSAIYFRWIVFHFIFQNKIKSKSKSISLLSPSTFTFD